MKCLIVFGTRPEAIKMASLAKRLRANPQVECRVCCTAQHREMLDMILELLQLRPDYDLDIMRRNQTPSDLTSRTLTAVDGTLEAWHPDAVFVQGDTTTSMAAALAAFYRKIPVHHVEAGLRTYSRYAPFPEEISRQLITRLASVHYAPTELARGNLLKENIPPESIAVTGNTVVDALLEITSRIETTPGLAESLAQQIQRAGYALTAREYILVTGHRRENFGPGMKNICRALMQIAKRHPETDLVYPAHLNPNVQEAVQEHLTGQGNIHLLPPLDYLAFVYMMMRAKFIISDSGGIQEEAPSLGKPVLVTRAATERPEAVRAGVALVVGTDAERIVQETERLLTNGTSLRETGEAGNPYGDGTAAEKIEAFLMREHLRA